MTEPPRCACGDKAVCIDNGVPYCAPCWMRQNARRPLPDARPERREGPQGVAADMAPILRYTRDRR